MRLKYIFLFAAAFLISSCSPSAEAQKKEVNTTGYDFVILHYNDFHAQNLPWTPTRSNPENVEVGGYAYLDAAMDSVENIYPQALRFHAGDDFQGTPVSAITRGESQFRIMNLIGLDLFTIGNHEFDYGWENIQKHLPEVNFPIGAANLVLTATGETPLEDVKIFEFYGRRMAVIPLTTPELDRLTLDRNTEGLEVLDPVQTARKYVDELSAEGIGLFVVLSHMGLDEDKLLAEAVPELDLIIGGHSHSYLPKAVIIGKTRIVQTGAQGRNLGIIKMNITDGDISTFDYALEEIRPSRIKPSADVLELVLALEEESGKELDDVIGILKQDWSRRGLVSNIGIWQCDAMMEAVGADIGFQNNGGIRKDLRAGDIKIRDIWEISPFGNTLVTFNVNGDQLKQMLEYMVGAGRFRSLQSSGFRMRADADGRITELTVGGAEPDPGRSYKVVTNNYVADDMDRNFGLDGVKAEDTMLVDRDVFIEAVRLQKVIDIAPDDRVRLE